MSLVSLSAWNFAQSPALVQALESSFLSDVANGLSSSAFLSPSAKSHIGSLIDGRASAREVGDALYRANLSEWRLRMTMQHGDEVFRSAWRSADRVFQPFENGLPPGGLASFEVGRDEEGAILEVSCRAEILSNDDCDAITGGLGLIDLALRSKGYCGFSSSMPDMALGHADGEWISSRLAPPSILEAHLRRLCGPAAARFFFASGEVKPSEFNAVHKAGYHPIGVPMEPIPIHSFKSSILGFGIHDESHGAYWSACIPPVLRIGSCLLYEALEESLPVSVMEGIQDLVDPLLDLNMIMNLGLSHTIRSLAEKLDSDGSSRVRETFRRKWDQAGMEGNPEELKEA